IMKQKESLKNLVIMLDHSTLDDKSKFIVTDLKLLELNFNAAEESKKGDVASIKDISQTVTALRKKLVAGS
ncbi:MAG: hypothetical protein ACXVNO_08120, partial [Bacteroidia bacterium]